MKGIFAKDYPWLTIVLCTILISLSGLYALAQNAAEMARAVIPDAGAIPASWEGNSNKSILIQGSCLADKLEAPGHLSLPLFR